MNIPLISIIVPVYKVEPYLRKCVDSILAQTYTNIEVILVDDGSPDGCPAICDEYAAKDRRVVVIHQRNAGVSVARNAGLDAAKGGYIAFVDSDDWIEPDLYEVLVEGVRTANVDIAISSSCGDREKPAKSGAGGCRVFSVEEAMRRILFGEWELLYVWGRLFSRRIVDVVRFSSALRLTQDGLFAIQAISRCRAIACSDYQGYHYVVRGDSACHAFDDGFWDTLKAIDEIVGAIKEYNASFASAADKCALLYDVNMVKAAEAKGMFTRYAYEKVVAHIRRYWNPDSCKLLPARARCWIRLLLLGRSPFLLGRGFFRGFMRLKTRIWTIR